MTLAINRLVIIIVSVALVGTSLAAVPGSAEWMLPGADKRNTGADGLRMPSIQVPSTAPDFDAISSRAFRVADSYEPSPFYVDELADALAYEPLAAFEFVRDEIRFDPYAGVLRGAAGALAARAGNAYDRSLLLSELLAHMGYETRLVFGTLEERNTGALLRRAVAHEPAEAQQTDALASIVGLPAILRERLLERATRDFFWLTDALQDKEFQGAQDSFSGASLNEHVWVQARLERDWTDLDTAFLDALPGSVYAEPAGFGRDPRPEDRHIVQINVVAESLSEGRLSEKTVLSSTLDAVEAIDNRIYLTFAPSNPTIGGTLAATLGPELQAAVPMLTVDGTESRGEIVAGVAHEQTAAREFFYGTGSDKLTAVYLDIETGKANGQRKKSRRPLFDRLSGAIRAHGNIETKDIASLPLVRGFPRAFMNVHQIVVSTGASNLHLAANNVGLAAYFTRKYVVVAEEREQLPFDSMMWPIAMVRFAQIAVAERMNVAALNDQAGLRFLIAEPRAYVFSNSVFGPDDEGSVDSIDLTHDHVHSVALEPVSRQHAGERRVWYGVLQSSLETTLMEVPVLAAGLDFDGFLSASVQSRGASMVIGSTTDSRLGDNVTGAIYRDLSAGRSVVISSQAASSGWQTWWSVARDGTTRAMLEPGLGGSKYRFKHNWGATKTRWKDGAPNCKPAGSACDTNLPPPESQPDNLLDILQEQLDAAQERADQRAKARQRKLNNPPKTRLSCGGGTEATITRCIAPVVLVVGAGVFSWWLYGVVVEALLSTSVMDITTLEHTREINE